MILQTQLHDLHCIKHNQADLINTYKCKGKRKKKKPAGNLPANADSAGHGVGLSEGLGRSPRRPRARADLSRVRSSPCTTRRALLGGGQVEGLDFFVCLKPILSDKLSLPPLYFFFNLFFFLDEVLHCHKQENLHKAPANNVFPLPLQPVSFTSPVPL